MSPSAEPEVARPGTSAFSVLAVVLAGFIGARLGVVIGISVVVLVAAVGALAGKETMQLRPVLLVAIVVATSWRADAVLGGLMVPETVLRCSFGCPPQYNSMVPLKGGLCPGSSIPSLKLFPSFRQQ